MERIGTLAARDRRQPPKASMRARFAASRRASRVLPLLAAALLPAAAAPDIFYKTQAQADADLRRFGLANPSCETWTNWQKLCSRVGGSVHCAADKAKPVRPTKAFCVGKWTEGGAEAQLSQLRFCAVRDAIFVSGERFEICDQYQAERPFNGRRLQPRLSPGCAEWREEGSGRRARASSRNGYYCAKFTQPMCRDHSLHQLRGAALAADGDGIIAGYEVGPILDKLAVHGLSCGGDQ